MSAEGATPPTSTGAPESSTGGIPETVVNSKDLQRAASFNQLTRSGASAAVNSIQNHPITQSVNDTVSNGPIAESVKTQATKTRNEISGLADSRASPSYTAASGQNLTHYHSFFYTLLTWKHPRATAISFVSIVLFIFACRYLPILRWMFKLAYMSFGVTALAEVAGRFLMGQGLTASIRPRQFYKIPKETLEASMDDLEQLINFFVIEFQRVLFAENPYVTTAAFASAFVSYYLVKILPLWGLALLSTCVAYLTPLIYLQNQEFIDEQINHVQGVISAQAAQVKDLASEHAGKGLESMHAYTGAAAAKAQELVGTARQKIPSPPLAKSRAVKENDFPAAPKTDLPSVEGEELKPAIGVNGEAVPTS